MRSFLVTVLALLLVLGQAVAQSPSSGGSDNPNPEAGTGGTFDNILEAIESGTKLLVRKIQPGEDRDKVENPRFNGQASPRETLMTFGEAMELVQRGYEEVGYTRAIASMPPGSTREDADALHAVFLRLGPPSPASLPDKDVIERTGDSRFEFFPRGTDHLWVWQTLDEPPTGEIAVGVRDDGRWLFTDTTMAGLPDLRSAMSSLPPRFGEDDGGAYFLHVFAPVFERTGLVGWLGFFGLTLAGLAGGVAISKGVSWLSARSSENDHGMIATTLGGLGASLGTLLFTVAFTIAMGFLTLGPVLRPLRFEIPRFLLVIALTMLIVSLIDTIAAFARRRTSDGTESGQYDEMVIAVIRRIMRTIVIAIALLFVAQNVFGVNIAALLVGFGVLTLALSLAAQDTVKNLFGAITIFVNRPFVIGDWIQFQGRMGSHWGVVEDISLQAVSLQDLTGNIVTIPNMQFIDREVQNLSAREYIRREVNLAIPYRADAREADRALEALRDVFTHEEIAQDAKTKGRDGQPHVSFAGFEEAWLTIRGYHYYYMGDEEEDVQRVTERGYFSWLDHCTMVNRKIVDVFGERDIEFAFPTQTIEMIRGDDRP